MNHLKRISYSKNSWCRLKRLQSSLSTSNPSIQIPSRIERGPTDILRALDSTVPKSRLRVSYKFQDDPFLLPFKRRDLTVYSLSYESGKRTAMWIYKQHGDLFPKNLSDPKIQAFTPPVVKIDESQVSEEALLQAISQFKSSNAVDIYKLLEGNVSNETKQALLELLCFNNSMADMFDKLPLEQWALPSQNKNIWLHNPEITVLYEFLIKQDSATAHMAYNAMLCGYAKCSKVEEAWLLYNECIKNNVPLSINTYNYILASLEKISFKNDEDKETNMLDIFTTMNNQRICPNIKTLNTALKVTSSIKSNAIATRFMRNLFNDFQELNINLSLASYNYAIIVIARSGDQNSYQDFIKILKEISQKSFIFQDLDDSKFFVTAMDVAFHYASKEAATIINNFLFTNNHYQFILTLSQESAYFQSYLLLMLLTSTIQEFFKIYKNIVPHMYIPHKKVLQEICCTLNKCPHDVLIEYMPRLWSDMADFELQETTLSISVLNAMDVVLHIKDSPLRELCADVALSCWNIITNETSVKNDIALEVSTASKIALHVLRDDRVEAALQILTVIGKHTIQFTTILNQKEVNKLFETCISKRCYAGAILLLEYCINFEFKYAVELAKTLHNILDLNDVERDQLIKLTESKDLDSYDTPQKN